MTVVLDGIYNFLSFINNNWAKIAAIIALIIAIYKKAKDFFSKSQEEQIKIAKAQIKEVILRLVTEAEKDYKLWNSAGEIKRSQVINQVFEMYPILSKVTNQEDIVAWIDDTINDALKTMRKIFEENETAATAE